MRTYHRNYIYESNDFENLCKFIVQDHSLKKEYFIFALTQTNRNIQESYSRE